MADLKCLKGHLISKELSTDAGHKIWYQGHNGNYTVEVDLEQGTARVICGTCSTPVSETLIVSKGSTPKKAPSGKE